MVPPVTTRAAPVSRMLTTSKVAGSAREWLSQWGVRKDLPLKLEPCPASRPRVTRTGVTYYAKTYREFQKESARILKGVKADPSAAPVLIMVEVVKTKARTSKLTYPRGDVDNYLKGPLDALNKSERVYLDDNQVVGLLGFKRFAEPDEAPGFYTTYVYLEDLQR